MKQSKTLSTQLDNTYFTESYLLNPRHKISVMLIGCGGTGSQVATCLARMNTTLLALGHPGFQVIFCDDDIVTEANIGRQLFSQSDVGKFKANVIAERINRFFGLNWTSHTEKVNGWIDGNILISCTDTISSRVKINNLFFNRNNNSNDCSINYYWLDFGNTNNTGQVILCDKAKKLPSIFKLFPSFKKKKDGKDVPSCSIAESIKKQDLFVNSTLAQLGCNLLWKLIHEGRLDYHGLFMNLETLTVKPIKIK